MPILHLTSKTKPASRRSSALRRLFDPFVLVLLAGVAGCRQDTPPDLILVSLDTTRADRFAAVAKASPELGPMWRDGARFAAAASPTPITLPAHASMLSGVDPNRHGIRNNGFRVAEDLPLLQERLSAAGYRTGAFVSAYPLDREFGLDRGFDRYDQPTGDPSATSVLERPARTTVQAALDWWRQREPEQPGFLFVHLFDAHAPFDAPGVPDSAPITDRYDAEIAGMGQALAPLLAALRESDRPFVLVLTGDHGEGLGEHGELDHGLFLYDSTLLVPMVWWAPGQFDAGERPGLPRLIDVAPTLLELAGVESLPDVQGVSLMPTLSGATQVLPPAYAESAYGQFAYGVRPLRSVREGALKWIGTDLPEAQELYAWQEDPRESDNRAAVMPNEADALQLVAFDRPEPEYVAANQSRSTRALQSLGYLGSAGASDGRADDHPATVIDIHRRLMTLQELDRSTHLADALALAREIVDEAPDLGYPRFVLGDLLAQSGDSRAAIAAFAQAIALNPEDAEIHWRLAELLLATGQDEASLPHWQAVIAIDPARSMARTNHAVALANLSRWDEAWATIEPALTRARDAGTLDAALTIAERTGRHAAAAALLEQHAALAGQPVDDLRLGRLYLYAGNPEAAIKSFARVPGGSPVADVAAMGKAAALDQLGKAAEAKALRDDVLRRAPLAHRFGLREFTMPAGAR